MAGRSIVHFSEVALQTAKTVISSSSTAAYSGYVPAKWSRLATYTTTAAPAYSFQIPPTAYTGQNFYVGFRIATTGTTVNYVGLIQFITIDSGTASSGSVTAVAEESSIWGTVIVSVLVTAAVAAVLFFFVL